jgi:hypothetical protein
MSKGLFQQINRERTIVVQTGIEGMKRISEGIRDYAILHPVRERAKELLANNIIPEQQYQSLIAMINSPDKESFELAESIIAAKENPDGTTIHSRGS